MRWLRKMSEDRSAAVLFGPRAERTATLLSDFDLLWIVEGDVDSDVLRREAARRSIDLFLVTVRDLDYALATNNSVLYDALTRGQVLYDTLGIIAPLKERVQHLIEEQGLQRSEIGWHKKAPR